MLEYLTEYSGRALDLALVTTKKTGTYANAFCIVSPISAGDSTT